VTGDGKLSFFRLPAWRSDRRAVFRFHHETLDWLREQGFPVSPFIETVASLEDVDSYCKKWLEGRHRHRL